jgi:hypothetical protein
MRIIPERMVNLTVITFAPTLPKQKYLGFVVGTVLCINRDDPLCIEKSVLGFEERYAVLSSIRRILSRIPLEFHMVV